MGVPDSKQELQDAISERFTKFEAALASVPKVAQNEKTMEGHAKGTLMSPADLVSYLIGWNSLVLKWLTLDDAGHSVVFPEVGYKWNALGALAQKFYADYEDLSFDDKHARLLAVKQQITKDISQRPENELYGAPWHGKWTKGRMIQLNTSSPYENARGRLRKWTKSSKLS